MSYILVVLMRSESLIVSKTSTRRSSGSHEFRESLILRISRNKNIGRVGFAYYLILGCESSSSDSAS